VGASQRRCGQVSAQMWASLGADVGASRLTTRERRCRAPSPRGASFSFISTCVTVPSVESGSLRRATESPAQRRTARCVPMPQPPKSSTQSTACPLSTHAHWSATPSHEARGPLRLGLLCATLHVACCTSHECTMHTAHRTLPRHCWCPRAGRCGYYLTCGEGPVNRLERVDRLQHWVIPEVIPGMVQYPTVGRAPLRKGA
jgi:hypothetical protein